MRFNLNKLPSKKNWDFFLSKSFVLLVCLLLASTFSAFAQTKSISGTITDETKESLIGVSVRIKGTTTGTVSDIDGKYTISANQGDILEFTFIGMNAQEITVGTKDVIDVVLTDNATLLTETVVIGYGSAKVKDLTSPIAIVNTEQLNKSLTSSPMQALQGKVSGVQIVNSGQPGSAPKVRIRGVSGFNKDKGGPLYVVDGMFLDDISFLSTGDIENMSILKDASSAAIYGVRAANGVVLITTKKGVPNRKPQVTYDGYVGFQKASNILKMANSDQYTAFMTEMGDTEIIKYINNSKALWGDKNGAPLADTNWYDELTKTALMHSHGVSINGGAENLSYAVGANYLSQDGIMNAKNGYERVNTRAKIDLGITKWLKAGASFIMTNSDQQTNSRNAWLAAYHNPSIYPIYDDNNTVAKPINFASPQQIGLDTYFQNPMALAKYGENQTYKTMHLLPSFYVEAQLLETKLTLKSMFSQDLKLTRFREFNPEYTVGGNQKTSSTSMQKRMEYNNNWIVDNTATYRDSFDKHTFSVMAGNSVRKDRWELLRAEGTKIPDGMEEYWYIHNGLQTPQNPEKSDNWADNGSEYRGLSYFGRITYDYAGKYLISATMRADGSSKYQEKWGYFPSVGLGWAVSEEAFMKNQRIFDFLKLRANWGKLGNDGVNPNDGFASVEYMNSIFNDSKVPGSFGLPYFASMRWEEVEEYDLGVDFTLLNSRLSGNIDYYNRKTLNAAFEKPLAYGAPRVQMNGGEMENSGFEIALNWNDNINKDFNYNIGLNLSTLRNRVKNLNGVYQVEDEDQIKRLGSPSDVFYGYKVIGVYQNWDEIRADKIAMENDLEPGDFKYQDTDGDEILTAEDRVVLGSHLPKFTLGGNIGFNYKQFDLGIMFQGQFNYKLLNTKRRARYYQSALNLDAEWAENRWTGEGSTNKYPSAKGSAKAWNIGKMNSFFVEDGSYFSIQNIQIGYTFDNILPNSASKSSLRLSLTAERPFNFFSYNGFTTDIADGKDNNVYPMASTYSFGVKFIY